MKKLILFSILVSWHYALSTPKKMDIIFVVDNSVSMKKPLAQFSQMSSAMLAKLNKLGVNYKIAVTTTEAWITYFSNNYNISKFRKDSGYAIITRSTPNAAQALATNINQQRFGSSDERAFQSLSATINNAANRPFVRNDAFLHIVMIGDEDDFSNYTPDKIEDYNHKDIYPVDYYVNFLDSVTIASELTDKFKVTTFGIFDSSCLAKLQGPWPNRRKSLRYKEMAQKTGGEGYQPLCHEEPFLRFTCANLL